MRFGSEFKVGIFVIVACVALFSIFIFLSPDFFKRYTYKKYYSMVDNADGVIDKTHIRTNGVKIGTVDRIDLAENKTKIIFAVEREIKIPVGSKLDIRSRGLLGDKYIEILRTDNEELIPEGGEVEVKSGSANPDEMMATASDIANDVKRITKVLANTIDSKEGEESVETVISDMTETMKELKEAMKDSRVKIDSTLTHLEKAASGISQVISKNQSAFDSIFGDLAYMSDSLRSALESENGDNNIERMMANIDEAIVNFKDTSTYVKNVSAKIQEGKGAVGRLIGDDGVIDKVEETIANVNKIIEPASNLQLGVDYRGEFRADKSSQHYFNLLFRTNRDKYYLFGLTDVGNKVLTTQKDTTPLGKEGEYLSYETKTITEDKAMRFNVQFAQRWYNLTMRFGLFESKGGFAADYHLLNNRLIFTLEAFDWNSGGGHKFRHVAHFKTYAKLTILDHLTMIAGVDDPTRIDSATSRIGKDINYFFSAGFTFTDNDLKGFLGTSSLAL